jgi:hypothetical protein
MIVQSTSEPVGCTCDPIGGANPRRDFAVEPKGRDVAHEKLVVMSSSTWLPKSERLKPRAYVLKRRAEAGPPPIETHRRTIETVELEDRIGRLEFRSQNIARIGVSAGWMVERIPTVYPHVPRNRRHVVSF